jgi:hypothetical protein
VLVYAEVAGREIIASAEGRTRLDPGAEVALSAPARELHLFDQASGVALR